MLDDLSLKFYTLISAIALAFVGYIVTYLNTTRIEAKKARLKFVSDQIQFLYGPLHAINETSSIAWLAFRRECRPEGAFFDSRKPPPTPDELKQWRLWMTEVFMPLNLKMENTIIENTHLFVEARIPADLLLFLAHVESYKATIKAWENGDFSRHTSSLNYPAKIKDDIAINYAKLRIAQTELMQVSFGERIIRKFRK